MTRIQLQPRSLATPLVTTLAREMDQLQSSIRRMFDNPFTAPDPFALPQALNFFPAMELTESPAELTMTVELPGMDSKDVHIDLDGDMLTVRGEKREERVEEDKEKQYYLQERSFGSFQRSFMIPPTVDTEKIAADFDKGILTLRMPKGKETRARGREIAINAR